MNKNNNTEEIKDAKGEVVRTLVFTDKDGVRTYKDKDTGETVKTLNICNGGVSDEPYAIQFNRKDAEGNKTLFPKNFVFQLTKKDEVKSTSVMFENCWLGGDPVMKTDTLVRMAAIKQLGAMFDRVVGTLKNV